jgi:transposase
MEPLRCQPHSKSCRWHPSRGHVCDLRTAYQGCRRIRARPQTTVATYLGAEFLVAAGDLCSFESADHLAAYARLVSAAHDSGKKTGNDKRMRGANKALKYFFYQSAFASLRSCPESRAFYDRKRAEGKRHIQALIALAR